MKTAEEVAEEIMVRRRWLFIDDGAELTKDITQALTQYAEERVKETISRKAFRGGYHLGDLQSTYQRGRAEALEEAAKIASKFGLPQGSPAVRSSCWAYKIEDEIRALKDKP